MDKSYYDSLPEKLAKRAKWYLDHAQKVAEDHFGHDKTQEIPLLVSNVALGMMQLEAAEVMAAAQDNIADKIEER